MTLRVKDTIEGKISNATNADTVPWSGVSGKPSTFTPSSHTHDDRYYTESEVDSKLNGKANSSHSHSYLPLSGGTVSGNVHFASIGDKAKAAGITWDGSTDGASIYYETRGSDSGHLVLNMTDDSNVTVDIAAGGAVQSYFGYDGTFHGNVSGNASSASSVAWSNVSGKPSTYAPSSHTHNYAGSSSAGGSANWANGSTYANYAFSNNGVSTSGSGSAYTANVSGFSLATGKSIVMIPHVTSTTTTPTLNVSGTGAKNIRMRLSSSTSSTIPLINSGFLTANKPVKVTYDGTYWVIDDFIQPDANNLYGTLISRGSSAPSSGTAGFIYIQTT